VISVFVGDFLEAGSGRRVNRSDVEDHPWAQPIMLVPIVLSDAMVTGQGGAVALDARALERASKP